MKSYRSSRLYVVLVCGSRDWDDYETIRDRLSRLPADTEIIEGGQHGADLMAKSAAESLGLEYIEYGAAWKGSLKRGAGFARNIKMLDREQPDLVIAFQLKRSRGTQHTIDEARKRGIEVEVHPQ